MNQLSIARSWASRLAQARIELDEGSALASDYNALKEGLWAWLESLPRSVRPFAETAFYNSLARWGFHSI